MRIKLNHRRFAVLGQLLALALHAQTATTTGYENTGGPGGIPGAYFHSDGIESVNQRNLNVNVKIPLIKLRGRNGRDIELDLIYNSSGLFTGVQGSQHMTRDLFAFCAPDGGEMLDIGDTTQPWETPTPEEFDVPFDNPGDDPGDDPDCDDACEESQGSSLKLDPTPLPPREGFGGGTAGMYQSAQDGPGVRKATFLKCDGSQFQAYGPLNGAYLSTGGWDYNRMTQSGYMTYADGSWAVGNVSVGDFQANSLAEGGLVGSDGSAANGDTDYERIVDNLGRGVLVKYGSVFQRPTEVKYQDDNGVLQTIYLHYTPTAFQPAGSTDWFVAGNPRPIVSYCDPNPGDRPGDCFQRDGCWWAPSRNPDNPLGCPSQALESIEFPNGDRYQFEWYKNPNGSNSGLLAKLTRPGGAYSRYVYHRPGGLTNAETYFNPNPPPDPAPYLKLGLDRFVSDPRHAVVDDPGELMTTYSACLDGQGDFQTAPGGGTVHVCKGRKTTYPDGTIEEATYEHEGMPDRLVVKAADGGVLKEVTTTPLLGGNRIGFAPAPQSVTVKVDGKLQYVKHFEYDQYLNPTREWIEDNTGTTVRNTASTFYADTDPAVWGPSGANNLRLKKSETVSKNGGSPSHTTEYNWDGGVLNSTTTYHDGRALVASNTYVANKQLHTATSPMGRTTTYGYSDSYAPQTGGCLGDPVDISPFPTTVTNSKEQQSTSTYYRCTGRLATQSGPNDIAASRVGESFVYDCIGAETSHTFAGGGEQTHTYPWNCAATTTPAAATTVDGTFDVVSRTKLDTRYLPTTTTYDSNGRSIKVETPDGMVVSTRYDDAGRVSYRSNPTDPLAASSTDGATWTTYDGLGRVVKVGDQAGNVTWTCYNGVGHNDQPAELCTLPNIQLERSPAAWTSTMDQAHHITHRAYDSLGQLIAVVEANGAVTTYAYDEFGNLASVTQPGLSGEASRIKREFEYDDLNRLTSSKNPETGTIHYTYDDDSNLHTETDARGVVKTFTYDALNRLTDTTFSDGTPGRHLRYDGDGAWAGPITNGIGRLTRAFTDPDLRHPGSATAPPCSTQNSPTANYNYANGNPTYCMWTDYLFSYDEMGRMSHQWSATPATAGWGGYDQGATYDLAGNLRSVQYPGGTMVSTDYDAAGRLQRVYDGQPGGAGQEFYRVDSYWPSGAVKKAIYGNSIIENLTQNSRLQPCESSVEPVTANHPWLGAVPWLSKEYFYGATNDSGQGCNPAANNNGNINFITDRLGGGYSQTFVYDNLNRIKNWDAPSVRTGPKHMTFGIDSFGNLTQANGSTAIDPTTVYGSNNRLLPSAVQCLGHYGESGGYDASGNTLCTGNSAAMEQDQYGWDGDSRMFQLWKQWHSTANLTAFYTYDAMGQRMRSDRIELGQTAPAWRQYNFMGGNVLAEEDSAEGWTRYIYAGGKKVASQRTLWGYGWKNNIIHFAAVAGPSAYEWRTINDGNGAVLSGQTIRTGDRLMWRQRQTASGHGGLNLVTNQGHMTAWNYTDASGGANSDDVTPPNQWVSRSIDLSGLDGDTISTISVGADTHSAGSFTIDYSEIALVRGNGDVLPVFNGAPVSFGTSGSSGTMQNVSVSAQIIPTDADPTHYFVGDHLATAQMEFASTGYPVYKGEFAPFGQELSDPTTTAHRYKFTGKERDTESGLDYFGARYYSSAVGRFISPDWAAKAEPVPYAKLDDPQSLNLYGYVGNNPLSKADPDGHCPWCLALAGGGVLQAETPLAALGPVGWTILGGTALVVGGAAIWNHYNKVAAPPPTTAAPAAPAQPTVETQPQAPTSSTGGETAGKKFRPRDRAQDAGKKCVYCERETTEEAGKENSRETDHGHPRSDGGNAEPENRNPSCRTCNRQKGRKTPEEFRKWQNLHPEKVPKALLVFPDPIRVAPRREEGYDHQIAA